MARLESCYRREKSVVGDARCRFSGRSKTFVPSAMQTSYGSFGPIVVRSRDIRHPTLSRFQCDTCRSGHPPHPFPLADLTLDVASKHFLDIDNTNGLERLILLLGNAGELERTLRNLHPFPDSGAPLLVRVLSELEGLSGRSLELRALWHSACSGLVHLWRYHVSRRII